MSAIVHNCGLSEDHEPHWITQPPEGVLGGSWCLGNAATTPIWPEDMLREAATTEQPDGAHDEGTSA